MASAIVKLTGRSRLKPVLLDLPKPTLESNRTVYHHLGRVRANVFYSKNPRIVNRERNPPEFPPLNREAIPRFEVNIPKRIKRNATAVLEALSSTVGRDPTSAGYRFMDDPYFIPVTNSNKRIYALSKESGRRAARYIVERNPLLFRKPTSDPEIPAFEASVLKEYQVPPNPDEKELRDRLTKGQLANAMEVYRAMKLQNLPVSPQVQQELLEWLCFYNGEDAANSEFLDEEWFKAFLQPDMRRKWRKDSAAEEVFNDLPEKTPAAYSAMICGMAKFINVESAKTYFEELEQMNVPIPTAVYNEMIRIVPMLQETFEARWEMSMVYLTKMKLAGVAPNIRTFNALLETLSKCGGWRSARQNALQIFAEMKLLNIQPSLGSYNYLLQIFCRDRGPVSHIIHDIMRQLEGKKLEHFDPSDSAFFVTAMEVAARHLQDPTVAKQVHGLLMRDQNDQFIPDSQKENVYYNNFFKALVSGESAEGFFEKYDELVPMTFTPDSNLIVEIIRMLEFHDRLNFLPRIWADCALFGHSLRDNIVITFLQTMVNNHKPEMAELFAVVAQDIRDRIDNQPINRDKKISWTGEMMGDVLILFLRNGDIESACQVFAQYLSLRGTIYGFPSPQALNELIDALLEQRDLAKIRDCLMIAADVGLPEVTARAEEITNRLALNPSEQEMLKSVINTSAIDLSDNV